MTIKYKNFTLTPGTHAKSTWDVTQTIETKVTGIHASKYPNLKVGDLTGETKEELVGYFSSIGQALPVIINLILAEKEETVSLSEFLVVYTKEKEDMVEAFNEVLNPVLK